MEHYFSKNPKSKLKVYKFTDNLRGNKMLFITASSTFSPRKIDKASKILIENCILPQKGKILDLGCGYGVIGLSIKKFNPKLSVVLSDINERALEFAKKNAELNNVSVEIIRSDIFDKIKNKFDTILLNPPMAAGRDVCKKMIKESYKHLKKNGNLQLVAFHNKGGKFLSGYMKDIFGNVSYLYKKGGVRIYFSKKI